MAITVTHTRVRWTSQHGVQVAPKQADGKLPYSGDYAASNGWTDIRYFYVDFKNYEMDIVIKPDHTVPQIASDAGAELAINGPFSYNVRPIGFIVKDGKLINDTVSAEKWADFILYQDHSMKVDQLNRNALQGIKIAFSSTPQLVKNGKIYVNTAGEGTPPDVYANRRPRTGLGFTQDQRLLVIVVDGDSTWDAGLRVDELAAVMIYLGAVEALNADGGESSVMVQYGQPISANKDQRKLGAAILFHPKTSPADLYPPNTPQWKIDSVEWMYDEGLLTDPAWKKTIDQALPLWAVAIVLRKLYEKLKP
ncbi:phosphodiester glycosidase family protein [Ammoniphilus sp. YIM 78166]|uniref:phosphodiester glycosidase family protein n=1 Tax=Ammoniphilus sp. YIM 78166 TaxID=1644106 RepID=UPI00107042E1|nr:phosphodiester glycosidase family protein [Ammoniphilus sp. YIM 78166]